SGPLHQHILSVLARSSTSCTQSSTAWFDGLLLPIPDGGEMAGAMFFINKMSILVESSGSRISSGSGGSPRIFSRGANVACAPNSAAVYFNVFVGTSSDVYRPGTVLGAFA